MKWMQKLYEELLNVITSKTQADAQFTHHVLPQSVDNIKVAWYDTKSAEKDIFSVPET